uniref:ABC transporter domain-containing protein n=1 Tax=Pseudictyota dubia TaxID=2749911 RepID=A0A7R9ZBK7_9STRA|mmetsp:Transcript_33889/g.62767  ORF Transcript_33889/g.62767 Transcript_33889/m.62767 type:complete len:352 (+) Transcript_33889:201-1256(+)|eukprot:CAMPEP_0197441174 /NCGR_PEP_ID=MMETSP1175-20131217/7510_1 /TAXON_ID=1003142 /ORGANISM="Triceratium dubium, Strain CCMP147" /LENGTH=351 /DNA_ID=CAMNT_0042971415 /DNA_START=44 /DNA_END=1099 /DNA_ORIENTATION=-
MCGPNKTDNDGGRITPKPLPSIPDYGSNAIEVNNLTFSYDNASPVLRDFDLTLETGSRCLLIGANGAGKSTLLRVLAGRHLPKDENVRVLGLNAFRDTRLNFHRAYLDCDWGMRTVAFAGAGVPLMADIPVHKMMDKLQRSYPERRDELVEMLGIDLDWRMHQLSDGQRRRVQILIGLIRPFKVLLLDEITTSLDVCVRQDLLRWLVRESDERGATIIYATHIFDGLDDWATHLVYLTDEGRTGWRGRTEDLDEYRRLKEGNHPAKMLAVADKWLRAELERNRAARRKEKAQGALANELDPTDRQGGYSSGRNLRMSDESASASAGGDPPLVRQGRLSDIMGNAGVMAKHT